MKIKKNHKIIIVDMILNIIATMIPTFVLQFILLPIVALKYNEYEYGLALTLISLITLFSQSFSVALSNTRLLMENEYKKLKIVGDFNYLLIISIISNVVFLFIGTYVYEGYFNFFNIILVIFLTITQIVRRYLLVSFRINLNYKAILYSNIVLIIGYLLGIVLFFIYPLWQLIYISGEVLSLMYVINKTKLLKEPIIKTKLFYKTSKHSSFLLIASFLGTASTYIDRLLIYPILGSRMVTVYYVATLLGKTLSMCITPINNVILSYLSRMNKFKKNSFNLMIISASTLGLFCYVFFIIISRVFLSFLYPAYAEESLRLIYITTMTAIVQMLCTIVNPVIMKFCNIVWQIWIYICEITMYVLLSFFLLSIYGIVGFCIAALFTAIIKFLIMITIYYKNDKLSK